MRPESGFRVSPNWPLIRKTTTTSHFFGMTSSSIFFDVAKFFLSSFCYWCKFHVNIVIDSAVFTISIYKGMTRNLETGNTLV